MSKTFVGFGELLVRLAPSGYLRFPQAESFTVNYTGAEGNMAIALAYMGVPSRLVTKLPDNEIGRCAMRKLAAYGVDTSSIVWGGDRLGLYYLERGASQRPSKIIYDRAGSAIAQADPGEYDWDEAFRDAGWFHFTGITAGLSDNAAACCRQACQAARRHNVKISCDLNYRKYLWTPEQAQAVMRPMMEYVDVLIANEEDSDKVLGIRAEGADVDSGSLSAESYAGLSQKLIETFGFEKVAITLRESISASVNGWSGILCDGKQVFQSKKYTIQLVDRVGGGDSFASGLIYGFLNDMPDQEALEYAVAASCLKQTIEFDFNLSSVEEVKALMKGSGSGRVVR